MTNTDKDYDAAADWAEHDMNLPKNSRTALRGDAASDFGRKVLERALGGRPSIDPEAGPGQHAPVRQVRLPHAVDVELRAIAHHEHRTVSAVLREAVEEYLTAHR
jgi:hypothetical protein